MNRLDRRSRGTSHEICAFLEEQRLELAQDCADGEAHLHSSWTKKLLAAVDSALIGCELLVKSGRECECGLPDVCQEEEETEGPDLRDLALDAPLLRYRLWKRKLA